MIPSIGKTSFALIILFLAIACKTPNANKTSALQNSASGSCTLPLYGEYFRVILQNDEPNASLACEILSEATQTGLEFLQLQFGAESLQQRLSDLAKNNMIAKERIPLFFASKSNSVNLKTTTILDGVSYGGIWIAPRFTGSSHKIDFRQTVDDVIQELLRLLVETNNTHFTTAAASMLTPVKLHTKHLPFDLISLAIYESQGQGLPSDFTIEKTLSFTTHDSALTCGYFRQVQSPAKTKAFLAFILRKNLLGDTPFKTALGFAPEETLFSDLARSDSPEFTNFVSRFHASNVSPEPQSFVHEIRTAQVKALMFHVIEQYGMKAFWQLYFMPNRYTGFADLTSQHHVALRQKFPELFTTHASAWSVYRDKLRTNPCLQTAMWNNAGCLTSANDTALNDLLTALNKNDGSQSTGIHPVIKRSEPMISFPLMQYTSAEFNLDAYCAADRLVQSQSKEVAEKIQ